MSQVKKKCGFCGSFVKHLHEKDMCGKCLEKRVNACSEDEKIEMAPPYPMSVLLKVKV